MTTIHCVCNDYSKLIGNIDEEYICSCGGMVSGFSSGDTHIDLEIVADSFHNHCLMVYSTFGITLDTGEYA